MVGRSVISDQTAAYNYSAPAQQRDPPDDSCASWGIACHWSGFSLCGDSIVENEHVNASEQQEKQLGLNGGIVNILIGSAT